MGWNGLRADSHMSTVVSSGLELLENMHAALTYKRACLDLVSNAKESEALETPQACSQYKQNRGGCVYIGAASGAPTC